MKRKEKVGIPSLYISICAVLLYFIWPYFISAILSTLNISGDLSLYVRLFANFLLMFMIIAIYFNGIKDDFNKLKKNFKKLYLKGAKIFIVGIILYTIVTALIVIFIPSLTNDNANSLLNIFDKTPFLLLISTVFYYPIVEELVFKKTFKDFLKKKWPFIIITATINGSFEIMLSYTTAVNLINIIPAVIFYGILSYVYYDTDNVLVSISYRMIYNLIPCIGALLNVALILI